MTGLATIWLVAFQGSLVILFHLQVTLPAICSISVVSMLNNQQTFTVDESLSYDFLFHFNHVRIIKQYFHKTSLILSPVPLVLFHYYKRLKGKGDIKYSRAEEHKCTNTCQGAFSFP